MLSPQIILIAIVSYFVVLTVISYFTGKEDNNEVFFNAKKSSNWAIVAFGMVGASLSGVTFISVPGWVGESQFTYFQVVIGYLIGYLIVANLLLPLYYKLGLTSIYEYLFTRFGKNSHYVGSISFLISRILGASFRLFLVAIVLQEYLFDDFGIPFEITVVISILLIWLYTRRGGIKTIVWTDTIQTSLMIIAVILSIYYINKDLGWTFSEFISSSDFKEFNKIFVTESFTERNYFLKSIIGGAFITICMTGLDQDMMQKNLSCKNLKEAQKNMFWFSLVLVLVNILFLGLGALLYIYASKFNISAVGDDLFAAVAMHEKMPIVVGILFLLGLIAAAYSSADSALTALTTSFCIDFINIEKKEKEKQLKIRKLSHLLFSFLLFVVILTFRWINDESVISTLFKVAGYTYGPLLGLYSFGLFTKWKIKDRWIIPVVVFSPVISYTLQCNSYDWWGFHFGFELLIVNGLLCFLGMLLIRDKKQKSIYKDSFVSKSSVLSIE